MSLHSPKPDTRSPYTYLSHAKIRELVRTGQGQDKNFDRLNLRGVNLQGASLVRASFIGSDLSDANLQDADLSRAKLVQTQLDRVVFDDVAKYKDIKPYLPPDEGRFHQLLTGCGV